MVQPGLTGPWQISTMGGLSLNDPPELDNQYIEKASFGSDIGIILITAATVFGKKPLEPTRLAERLGWPTVPSGLAGSATRRATAACTSSSTVTRSANGTVAIALSATDDTATLTVAADGPGPGRITAVGRRRHPP